MSATKIQWKGKPAILNLMTNITEQKQAEEPLQESQRRLTDIIEFLPDATLAIDQEGKAIAWNRAVEVMTGVKKGDIPGKGDYEYAMPFYGTRRPMLINFISMWDKDIEKQYSFIKKEGDTLFTETNVPFVGGKSRILWGKASPLYSTEGKVVGAIESIRDVTERKELEKAIQESEEQFRKMFETSPLGMVMTGIDFRFMRLNTAFCKMLGYTEQELFSFTFKDITHAEHLAEDAFHVNEMILKKVSLYRTQKRYIRKDGSIMWGSSTVNIVHDRDGRFLYSLTTVEDITERRRSEEEKAHLETQLQQARKMEAIGTLSGGIAHDFNNILMGIQGYTSLMILDTSSDHPHYEWLKLIEEQVKSAADLTKQLLGFARGGKYEVKPVNMNELIEKTSTMFGRNKKEVSIRSRHEKDIWAVEADPSQIEQIFLNLYLNAWQAMPAGGDLSLETRNVVADEVYAKTYSMASGRYVRISVSDTGVGMDEKTKERIFEPFFTTKGLGRGTGLGLAMVYGIVKGHDGFIDIISETGKGTTFVIHFPIVYWLPTTSRKQHRQPLRCYNSFQAVMNGLK